jgi:hypothetical protein
MRPAAPPSLVVNGVFNIMIPVRNSYLLSEHLPVVALGGTLRGRQRLALQRNDSRLRTAERAAEYSVHPLGA